MSRNTTTASVPTRSAMKGKKALLPATTVADASTSEEVITEEKRILAERYKTKMCNKYVQNGTCPYEVRCMFAHGEEELRTSEDNLRDGLTTPEAIKEFQHQQQQRRRGAAPARGSHSPHAHSQRQQQSTMAPSKSVTSIHSSTSDGAITPSFRGVPTEAQAVENQESNDVPATAAAAEYPEMNLMNSAHEQQYYDYGAFPEEYYQDEQNAYMPIAAVPQYYMHNPYACDPLYPADRYYYSEQEFNESYNISGSDAYVDGVGMEEHEMYYGEESNHYYHQYDDGYAYADAVASFITPMVPSIAAASSSIATPSAMLRHRHMSAMSISSPSNSSIGEEEEDYYNRSSTGSLCLCKDTAMSATTATTPAASATAYCKSAAKARAGGK